MKKKLLTILLACSISVGVVACGDTESKSNDTSKTSGHKNNSLVDENSETMTNDSNDNHTEEATEKTLTDIENYMLENGAISGEKTKMAADMVGAVDGFKYKDSDVEVYEYDINSEEYIKLSNGEEIPLQGMESVTVSASAINGKFILMGNPTQEIISVFNSFK